MESATNPKNELHTMIDLIKDESILVAIYTLLKKGGRGQETYATVGAAELLAIDQGLAQLENGKEYEHEEAEKIYTLWQQR
jgi:hypothetical protein